MGYLLDLAMAGLAEPATKPGADLEASKEDREERAAILEFCAGYSRAEAERVAAITH